MRRHIISLLMLLIAFAGMAGKHTPMLPDGAADRAKWMREMQQHQNDFLAKELELTDKQRADFLPLYNQMRDEILNLSKSSRDKAKAVKDKGTAATDADYEAATKAYLDFRAREVEIVKSYYKKFGHILSKRQLYRLEQSERKFDRMLMQHRGDRDKPKSGKESNKNNKKKGHK